MGADLSESSLNLTNDAADEETTVRCEVGRPDPIAMNARLAKSRWSPYSPRRSVGSVERGS